MNTDFISKYVDKGDFTGLFVEELGWGRPQGGGRHLTVPIDGGDVTIQEVATLKGVTVWATSSLPDGRTQREIDRHVKKESNERLLIFHDIRRQQWKWPQSRDPAGAGSPRLVTHEHTVGRSNPALAQRLQMVSIGFDEEPSVVEINRRLRRAFDADAVTKKFYRSFATHHDDLCKAIQGIEDTSDDPSQSELRWYGSLLMNRLMFIYFMQRKGFLDDDLHYLRNRLERLQTMERPGSFYEFYTDFLIPLFHHGLGGPPAARATVEPAISDLIGDVPYVNGGIFAQHVIERAYEITVPDSVFVEIFDFFDSWQWHLDDRPRGNPEEINPDVLGYIFEQFVNQKQQGAYYTKEDVTGFMTNNALLPLVLERMEQVSEVRFKDLLASDPDRYIWDTLQHGADEPMPSRIADEGSTWPRPTWEKSSPDSTFALPGETWWEVDDRRRHLEHLRKQLIAGRIDTSDALVTANLDLENLAVDAIDAIESADAVVSAWRLLTEIKIVDPTCGSGAFLFAALNTLHSLYRAVIDAAFAQEQLGSHPGIATLLETVRGHSNLDYYLLKHATLNNLYGVDLMPEAVEIARLRLFLKLMSQIEDRKDLEPLPDLEFNIRPGNVLVGALDVEDIRAHSDLTNLNRVDDLVASAAEASATYRVFAEAQETGDRQTADRSRTRLDNVNREVREVLNGWWHEAARSVSDVGAYIDVHRPFHWFIEFPEVFGEGGFDVVIGNPPYINRRDISYHYSGFQTDNVPDIFAPCTEQSLRILRPGGRLALITPHSLMQSSQFKPLRLYISRVSRQVAVSAFARIPSGLFENDVRVRNAILLATKSDGQQTEVVHSSRCRRWYQHQRPHLLAQIRYAAVPADPEQWPFIDDELLKELWSRIGATTPGALAHDSSAHDSTDGDRTLYFKTNAYNYLSVSLDPVPVLEADGSAGETSAQKEIYFSDRESRDFAYLTLAGRLGLIWWSMWGDDFNVTKGVLLSFPVSYRGAETSLAGSVLSHLDVVHEAQRDAVTWKQNKGKRIGNWNLARCRPATDLVDQELLDAVGATVDEKAAAWTAYHRVYMSGDD